MFFIVKRLFLQPLFPQKTSFYVDRKEHGSLTTCNMKKSAKEGRKTHQTEAWKLCWNWRTHCVIICFFNCWLHWQMSACRTIQSVAPEWYEKVTEHIPTGSYQPTNELLERDSLPHMMIWLILRCSSLYWSVSVDRTTPRWHCIDAPPWKRPSDNLRVWKYVFLRSSHACLSYRSTLGPLFTVPQSLLHISFTPSDSSYPSGV